jgi:predicted kinase
MGKNLILIAGLPGTGKTTTASKLEDNLEGYHLVDQNELRRKAGMKRMPKRQDKINREIDILTADYLRRGRGVIVESGHRQIVRRNQLYGVASCCGANAVVLECVCSEEKSKIRMGARGSGDGLISDPNNAKVYDRIKKYWEDIAIDFKYPGQDFVSYLRYDTELDRIWAPEVECELMGGIKVVKPQISYGMKGFINRMGKTLIGKEIEVQ